MSCKKFLRLCSKKYKKKIIKKKKLLKNLKKFSFPKLLFRKRKEIYEVNEKCLSEVEDELADLSELFFCTAITIARMSLIYKADASRRLSINSRVFAACVNYIFLSRTNARIDVFRISIGRFAAFTRSCSRFVMSIFFRSPKHQPIPSDGSLRGIFSTFLRVVFCIERHRLVSRSAATTCDAAFVTVHQDWI